jgi:hypothetical protein
MDKGLCGRLKTEDGYQDEQRKRFHGAKMGASFLFIQKSKNDDLFRVLLIKKFYYLN